MPTIVLSVGAANKDQWGSQNPTGTGWEAGHGLGLTPMQVGYHASVSGAVGSSIYFDHADVQLLRGKTITSAIFQPRRDSSENGIVGSPITRVYGDKTNAAPGVCTSASDFRTGRVLTTAFTQRDGSSGAPAVGSRWSIDVTSVIQEIVNAFPLTLSGINLLWRDAGSAPNFTFYKITSYDNSAANAPQLSVTYSDGNATAAAVASLPNLSSVVAGGIDNRSVWLSSTEEFGAGITVRQNVTFWSDTEIHYTVVPGALSPGAVWIFVIDRDGLLSEGIPATLGSITGTAFVDLSGLNASGSAVIGRFANGDTDLPSITASGSANKTNSASGIPSLPGLNASGIASTRQSGSVVTSLPNLAASGAAAITKTSSGSVALNGLNVQASAVQIPRATANLVFGSLVANAGAIFGDEADGIGEVSLMGLVASGAAISPTAGILVTTLPSLTVSGQSVQTNSATSNATLPSLFASGQGVENISASAVASLPSLISDGDAVYTMSGTVHPFLPSLVSSGVAEFVQNPEGNASVDLPSLSASGDSLLTIDSVGSVNLPSIFSQAQGDIGVGGIGVVSLPSVIASGSVDAPFVGVAIVNLPSLTAAGNVILAVIEDLDPIYDGYLGLEDLVDPETWISNAPPSGYIKPYRPTGY